MTSLFLLPNKQSKKLKTNMFCGNVMLRRIYVYSFSCSIQQMAFFVCVEFALASSTYYTENLFTISGICTTKQNSFPFVFSTYNPCNYHQQFAEKTLAYCLQLWSRLSLKSFILMDQSFVFFDIRFFHIDFFSTILAQMR